MLQNFANDDGFNLQLPEIMRQKIIIDKCDLALHVSGFAGEVSLCLFNGAGAGVNTNDIDAFSRQ